MRVIKWCQKSYRLKTYGFIGWLLSNLNIYYEKAKAKQRLSINLNELDEELTLIQSI